MKRVLKLICDPSTFQRKIIEKQEERNPNNDIDYLYDADRKTIWVKTENNDKFRRLRIV